MRMDPISALQWPAMAVTVLAAWLVGSSRGFRRHWGFWCFLASNGLWAVWGVHDHAYALILLQACLAAMNIRGVLRVAHCHHDRRPSQPVEACHLP
jgi:hypothetical protein